MRPSRPSLTASSLHIRRQLGAAGCRAMLAVPVSFVSEHIETLEEMDMEYRELVRSCHDRLSTVLMLLSWSHFCLPRLTARAVKLVAAKQYVQPTAPLAGGCAAFCCCNLSSCISCHEYLQGL